MAATDPPNLTWFGDLLCQNGLLGLKTTPGRGAALSTFLWWDYGYGTLGKVLWNEVCVAHVAMGELRVQH